MTGRCRPRGAPGWWGLTRHQTGRPAHAAAAGRRARGRRLRGPPAVRLHSEDKAEPQKQKVGESFSGAAWTTVGGTVRKKRRRKRDSQCCRKYLSKSSTRGIRQNSGCCICSNPLLLNCFDPMNCMYFSESFIHKVFMTLQVFNTLGAVQMPWAPVARPGVPTQAAESPPAIRLQGARPWRVGGVGCVCVGGLRRVPGLGEET